MTDLHKNAPLELRREVAKLATGIEAMLKKAEKDLKRTTGVRKEFTILVLVNMLDFLEESSRRSRNDRALVINTVEFAKEISLGSKKKLKPIDRLLKMQNAVRILMINRKLAKVAVEEFLKWRCSLERDGEEPEKVRGDYSETMDEIMALVPDRSLLETRA